MSKSMFNYSFQIYHSFNIIDIIVWFDGFKFFFLDCFTGLIVLFYGSRKVFELNNKIW